MSYYVGEFGELYRYHNSGCKKYHYKKEEQYDTCLDCIEKKKVCWSTCKDKKKKCHDQKCFSNPYLYNWPQLYSS